MPSLRGSTLSLRGERDEDLSLGQGGSGFDLMSLFRRNKQPNLNDLQVFPQGSEEYNRDLQARNGGLVTGRDNDVIEKLSTAISSGSIPVETAEKLIHRNPNAPELVTAFRRNKVFDEAFGKLPDVVSGQRMVDPGGAGLPPIFESTGENVEMTGGRRFDLGAAIGGLSRLGDFKTANDISEIANRVFRGQKDKSGGEITGPKLAAALHGIPTGISEIDELAKTNEGKNKIKAALNQFQSLTPIISFNSDTGQFETRMTPRSEAMGAVSTPNLPKEVEGLGKAIMTSQIGSAGPALIFLDEKINIFDKTGELPGVGNLKNLSKSNFLKTHEGRIIQSAVQTIFNDELRKASGVAVTEWEEQRKRIQDAMTAANTAEDYVKVYKLFIRPRWDNTIKLIKAQHGNKAVEILKSRGGIDLDSFLSKTKSGGSQELTPNQKRLKKLLGE